MQRDFGWALQIPQDMRYAARQFRRAPAFAVFTVLVLALGIGTVTAMYTIAYAVLLKPLPFRAERSVFQPVEKSTKGAENLSIPFDEVREWQRATSGSADIAFSGGGLNIADGPAGAVLITEVQASPNLFALLGTQPALGRGFRPEEQETNHPHVAVLSDAMWRQNSGADPGALGKTLHIGGNPYTVIGVMPPRFEYPLYDNRPEVWVPHDRGELARGLHEPCRSVENGIDDASTAIGKLQLETQSSSRRSGSLALTDEGMRG